MFGFWFFVSGIWMFDKFFYPNTETCLLFFIACIFFYGLLIVHAKIKIVVVYSIMADDFKMYLALYTMRYKIRKTLLWLGSRRTIKLPWFFANDLHVTKGPVWNPIDVQISRRESSRRIRLRRFVCFSTGKTGVSQLRDMVSFLEFRLLKLHEGSDKSFKFPISVKLIYQFFNNYFELFLKKYVYFTRFYGLRILAFYYNQKFKSNPVAIVNGLENNALSTVHQVLSPNIDLGLRISCVDVAFLDYVSYLADKILIMNYFYCFCKYVNLFYLFYFFSLTF